MKSKCVLTADRGCSELTLTPEAAEAVADFYSELRGASSQENALPVTVRTLETIIRLSTAAAKARLAPGASKLLGVPTQWRETAEGIPECITRSRESQPVECQQESS